jgi:hypothetical protein
MGRVSARVALDSVYGLCWLNFLWVKLTAIISQRKLANLWNFVSREERSEVQILMTLRVIEIICVKVRRKDRREFQLWRYESGSVQDVIELCFLLRHGPREICTIASSHHLSICSSVRPFSRLKNSFALFPGRRFIANAQLRNVRNWSSVIGFIVGAFFGGKSRRQQFQREMSPLLDIHNDGVRRSIDTRIFF